MLPAALLLEKAVELPEQEFLCPSLSLSAFHSQALCAAQKQAQVSHASDYLPPFPVQTSKIKAAYTVFRHNLL